MNGQTFHTCSSQPFCHKHKLLHTYIHTLQGGNRNNFEAKEECDDTCVHPEGKQVSKKKPPSPAGSPPILSLLLLP